MMLLSIVIFTFTSPLPCMLSDITQPDQEPISNTQPDLEPFSNTQPDLITFISDMVEFVHEAALKACGNLSLFPRQKILHNASMYCRHAFDTLHQLGGKFEELDCRRFYGEPGCHRRGRFGTYECTVRVRRNRFTSIPYFGDYLDVSQVEATTLTYCARPIINLYKKLERKKKDAKRKKEKL